MDTDILVIRQGVRGVTSVKASASSIAALRITAWYGQLPDGKTKAESFSLTHAYTGRAINTVPLTQPEIESLVAELADCPIEWEQIDEPPTIQRYFLRNLSDKAHAIATGKSL